MNEIRYLILNKDKEILYALRRNRYFGQWDFSRPGELQGGYAIDLDVLPPDMYAEYMEKLRLFQEAS